MADTNLTLFLHGKQDLRLGYRPIPEPGKGEVLLEVCVVGLCGTDVHFLQHGEAYGHVVRQPTILGHEYSARVADVGPGVTTLTTGDRVAVENPVPCSRCPACRGGRYSLCPSLKNFGKVADHGALTRWRTHPATWCHKLPPHVTYEEGALCEPLAVGVHACRRAGVGVGQRVLVCGAGAVGVLTLMVARTAGATAICVTDVSEQRLSFAQTCGATCTVLVGDDSARQVAQRVVSSLGGPPDITIECSSAESSVQAACYATRSGGVVATVGIGDAMATIPILETTTREVDIRGVMSYYNCYRAAIDLVASGAIDVKRLITHRYSLDDAAAALKASQDGAVIGALKVVVECRTEVDYSKQE